MSPRRVAPAPDPGARAELLRASVGFGAAVRDARAAHGWSVVELADRAGLSRDVIYRIEAGQAASSDACARVAVALRRRLEFQLVEPRRRAQGVRSLERDIVHSRMAEFEARHLRGRGLAVGIDEPYQHFQFAGRADLVAWDLDRRALLHIENRTRFPDFQEMAGAYNAKRAYLGQALAERMGVGSWRSETHMIAAVWSSEVLHALRLRTESFRSLCPDGKTALDGWWSGDLPDRGRMSGLVVLDPLATGRARPYVGLDGALVVRPRYRGYADLAARVDRAA
jgi:transcriptional regulator with XRE-family HTH domain